MVVFWLVALIAFIIIEGLTFGLNSIWFAAGSLAAMISAALNAPTWLQVVLFIVVSALTLYFTRPLVKNFLVPKITSTNADRVVNKVGVVTETIDNITGTGAVSVEKKLWTARSEDGDAIPEGERVRVIRISGVKLFVKRVPVKAPDDEDASQLTDLRR